MHVSLQNRGILFLRSQQRTFRQQAVFISVSEKKLPERQQVGVVPLRLGPWHTGTIPIETRLRDSVDESKRLKAVHVAGRKDIDLRQAGFERLLQHAIEQGFELP